MTDAETWTPPTDAEAEAALAEFAARVRAHYGDRLEGVYLFGSRARGDHRPDSDADVAVVLAEPRIDFWTEKDRLGAWAFDVFMRRGLRVQAWPLARSEWRLERESRPFGMLLASARADARPLGAPS